MRTPGRVAMCLVAGASCTMLACSRSSPPELATFVAPAEPVAESTTKPATDTQPVVVAEAPAPEPPPEAAPPPVAAAPPPPAPEPKPEPEPAAPTIVGVWRVTDMSNNGQSPPQMAEMQITLTFTGDGTVTMSMSAPNMPESPPRSGTYTLDGTDLTMTMDGRAQSGTATFESNDQLRIEIDQTVMTLSRQ